jgi:hypothetical protein
MSPYSSCPGGSELWNWLKAVPAHPTQLAWCHTTDAYRLRSIVKAGMLSPTHCPVFREDLLYFFYGRPAYRYEGPDSLALAAKAPVVIVCSPNLVDLGTRIFPFDSGAFEHRYKKWLHSDMTLRDFELACGDDAPSRHVQAFFGTNNDYMLLNALTPGPPCPGHFEVESMTRMIADTSADPADDRRLAVELQVATPVPFDASSIISIIVPDELTQVAWFNDYFAGPGMGIDVQTYPLALLRRASHYQVALEQKVMEIQKNRGLL